jgi:CRP/FNR family transcriptional regulator
VKVSLSARDGKTIILRIVEPGEVLGLSATVCGHPYELTAETMEPCQVNFVKREDFLRFLKENTDACFKVAEQLSAKYNNTCHELRSFRTFTLGMRKAGQAAVGMGFPER